MRGWAPPLALRQAAVRYEIPCHTNLAGAKAVVEAIRFCQSGKMGVRSLQEYYAL